MPVSQTEKLDVLKALKKVKELLETSSSIGVVQSSMLQLISATISEDETNKKHKCHLVVRIPEFSAKTAQFMIVDREFEYIFEDDTIVGQYTEDKTNQGLVPK